MVMNHVLKYIEEHLEYLELEGFKIEKEITISSVQLQLDLSMMKRMMENNIWIDFSV